MELRELSRALLESQVAVVATLGQLVAAVAGPDGDVLLAVSPGSLHEALEAFIGHLRATLGHHGVTSLGETLAALGAIPGPSWAHVTGAASAWRGSVATVANSWTQLATEATRLRDACGDAATGEATTAATSAERAGDLQEKEMEWATSVGELVATARELPVVTDKEKKDLAVKEHEDKMEGATNKARVARGAVEDSVVATSQAKAATKRGERARAALGPLKDLVAACAEATGLHQELSRRVGDIEATLLGIEVAPDVPEGLVATVAEGERLWEASARLTTRHLQGTLGDICMLLPGGPGGLGGPSGRTVTERCQKAREDIPRLLWG